MGRAGLYFLAWQLGQVEAEQHEDDYNHGDGDAQALLEDGPGRAKAGYKRSGEEQPATEAAQVGPIVDAQPVVRNPCANADGSAKDQVECGKVDHRPALLFQFQRGYGQTIRLKQDDQGSSDAEDCARGSRAGRKSAQIVILYPVLVIRK